MKKQLLNSAGIALLLAAGVTTGANSAQALQLGPGTLSVRTNAGIFFSDNIVDFVSTPGVKSLGTPGTGTVTTPANIDGVLDSGVFGVTNGVFPNTVPEPSADILAALAGRDFVGAPILLNDLIVPFNVVDNTPINVAALNGGNPFPFIFFDTDSDGLFGTPGVAQGGLAANADTNDFYYAVTQITRRVSSNAGGIDISFDLVGDFIDQTGNFVATPSIVSIFNGTSNVNPNSLGVLTPAEYAAATVAGGQIAFLASADGTITTNANSIPEPGTIAGLTVIAGLGLGSRLKRKSK